MKFYIRTDKFTTSFKNPGEMNIGDTFQFIAKKYADKDTTQFIGNTYAYYRVLEVTKISDKVFDTVCYSNRQLVFDSKGMIMTSGISNQRITLDDNSNITNLQFIKNNMIANTGTGEFEGMKGTYTPKTISPNYYEATIDTTNNNMLSNVMISLLALYILYTLYNSNKKA